MAELARPVSRYRWLVLGVCWLAYVIVYIQRLSIGPLAPFLKEDLSLTAAQIGTLMSASAFGYMVTLIPGGWFVDRIGIRWMLFIGEFTGGIFIAAMFTVQTYAMGLLFMGLAGFGLGVIMPTTTKAVLVWFPVKERATAMGLKQTGLNVGGIVTASLLPIVAIVLSWHYGFLGIGALSVIIGMVSLVLYKEPPKDISFNISESAESLSLRTSVREIFGNREIWFVSLTGLCMAVVEFSVLAYFVLYLQEMLLFAVVTAGLFLALLQAGGALGKPVAGFVSDRLFSGRRKLVYILLCAITGVICLVWASLGQGSPLWITGVLAAVLGLSGISWGGIHLTLVGEIAGKELAGEVTGASMVFVLLGSIFGPPFFGYIFDVTGTYQMAWQFLATLTIAAVVFLLFVREERRRI
jgi:sugar phosphate permease